MRARTRSVTLDAIRGVAILQVLIWHWVVPGAAHRAPVVGNALALTWTGVDLFFVLSGFLIGGIVLDRRDSPNFYAVFYGRRALRIIPLYAVLLAILVWTSGTAAGLLPYATFTQNFTLAAAHTFGSPWSGITWSLAVEEQFYLVLPLLVRTVSQRRLPYVIAALIAAAPVCRYVAALVYADPHAAYLLFPCRMDALFAGVLLAYFSRHGNLRSGGGPLVLVGLWAGYLVLLAWPDPLGLAMRSLGYTWVAATYAASIALALDTPWLEDAVQRYGLPFSAAGLGAYSMYLFHRPIENTVAALGIGYAATIAVSAIALAALASLSWVLVERPLITFGGRTLRYRERPVDGDKDPGFGVFAKGSPTA